MLQKDGKYYFMWSEGGWTGPNYAVAYAIGASPSSWNRSTTARNRNSTSLACSNRARISPSIAISRGSSVNPIASAIAG